MVPVKWPRGDQTGRWCEGENINGHRSREINPRVQWSRRNGRKEGNSHAKKTENTLTHETSSFQTSDSILVIQQLERPIQHNKIIERPVEGGVEIMAPLVSNAFRMLTDVC